MANQAAFSNLLVVGILLSLATIIYCKIKNKTLLEVFKEFKEMISPTDE